MTDDPTAIRGQVDKKLDSKIIREGGFSTTLSYEDHMRLREITKRVHLQNFPGHMITDREADRIIDVMAPETTQYLIRKHIFNERG